MTTAKKVGTGIAVSVLIALVALATYVLYFYVGDRALPNTYVGSVKVTGATAAEIAQDLNDAVESGQISFHGDEIHASTAKLADLGVKVDTKEIAEKATASASQPLAYFKALFIETKVQPKFSTDTKALHAFSDELLKNSSIAKDPVEPQVIAKDNKFVVSPGKDGTGIDDAQLTAAANKLLATQRDVKATLSLTDIAPSTPVEHVQAIADEANKMLNTEITLKVGDEIRTADTATKIAWIACTSEKPELNRDAIKAWVDSHSKSLSVEEIVGARYKNVDGTVTWVKREARAGVQVTNVDAVSASIADGLVQAKAVNAALTTKTSEPRWEDKVIAAGAENLAYPAAEGEKWIDVNVTNNTVTAYVGAKPVYGPIGMIDGAPATPTILGTYQVYLKNPLMTMRGKNADGTPYETPNVPHAMFFSGGYALHGSSAWRSSWGYDAGAGGSHGCVNLSNSDARWLYNWAPIGTTVVSHR